MIIRIVKLTLKKDMVSDFFKEFNNVHKKIASFEGCSHVELLADENDNGIVFTYSHWRDPDALNNYRDSPLFGETWGTVKAMFAAKPEAWSLNRYDLNKKKFEDN